MSLKKFGAVLLAVLVLGVIAANGASAANEYNGEVGSAWYTGASPGTKLAEGESKTVTGELSGEKASLETTIAGLPFDITWKLWELTESSFRNENLGGGRWSGTTRDIWTLQAVAVTIPIHCSVPEKITTKTLTGTVAMKKGSGTVATVKFAPESGTTIATIEVTGAECPIAGVYKLTGAIFAEAASATGVFGSSQTLKFSQAIQESAGEAKSLKLGESAAFVTGALKFGIGGTEFAAKEN
jgi:hypothetical protein